MDSIHERISYLVDAYGDGKNTVFAKLVGESEANIRGYRTSVIPKHTFLEKVVRNIEISPLWLLTGEGDIVIQSSNNTDECNQTINTLIDKVQDLSIQLGVAKTELEFFKRKASAETGVGDAGCAAAG